MTEIIDPHPNVIDDSQTMQVTPPIRPRDPRCNCGGEDMHSGDPLPEDAPVLADGHRHDLDCVATNGQTRAVTAALNLGRIGEALTEWAKAVVDRSPAGPNLGLELDGKWSIDVRVRIMPGAEPSSAKVSLRITATETPAKLSKGRLTEERYALIDLLDAEASPAMIVGTFQTAIAELIGVALPVLRDRLLRVGVLIAPSTPCAGALCIGCGNLICPRRHGGR